MSYLYDHYSAALYGIILRMVRIDEVAEDVLQETFIKAWKNSGYYDETKGRLFTWLIQIARCTALDQLRSKNHRYFSKNDRLNDDNMEMLSNSHRTTTNTDAIGIKALTGILSDELRSIINLLYFEGYTHTEAALALNIPEGTLKTRLRKAIGLLHKCFNGAA